ncbi:MAG: amino acid ABC transporter permease [Chloroflexota bacterium]
MALDWLGPWLQLILEATLLTIGLAALALVGSAIVGVTIALLRIFGWRPVKVIVIVLVDFLRGTPLLVQLLIWFLVPPVLFDIEVDPFQAAVIGLSVNGGAFLSEIIRGAVQAVPKGQREAAAALGLGRFYAFRTIELPQAMPVILPAGVSFYVGLIKDTSIAYIVGLHELLKTSQLITMQETAHTFELYVLAAIIYFVICFSFSRVALRLERRYRQSGLVSERIPT